MDILYFDIIPSDILNLIVVNLDLEGFYTLESIFPITDYKGLVITAFDVIPKRLYNWKKLYESWLEIQKNGFDTINIRRPIIDDEYDNILRFCDNTEYDFSKYNKINIETLERYNRECTDIDKNRPTVRNSYLSLYHGFNFTLLRFLIYEDIYILDYSLSIRLLPPTIVSKDYQSTIKLLEIIGNDVINNDISFIKISIDYLLDDINKFQNKDKYLINYNNCFILFKILTGLKSTTDWNKDLTGYDEYLKKQNAVTDTLDYIFTNKLISDDRVIKHIANNAFGLYLELQRRYNLSLPRHRHKFIKFMMRSTTPLDVFVFILNNYYPLGVPIPDDLRILLIPRTIKSKVKGRTQDPHLLYDILDDYTRNVNQ